MAVASAPTEQPGPAAGGGERVRGAAGCTWRCGYGAIAATPVKARHRRRSRTMAGGRQARKNKAAKEQQAEQAKAGTLEQFNKGFSACMEGRGYA